MDCATHRVRREPEGLRPLCDVSQALVTKVGIEVRPGGLQFFQGDVTISIDVGIVELGLADDTVAVEVHGMIATTVLSEDVKADASGGEAEECQSGE